MVIYTSKTNFIIMFIDLDYPRAEVGDEFGTSIARHARSPACSVRLRLAMHGRRRVRQVYCIAWHGCRRVRHVYRVAKHVWRRVQLVY
ncbi:unnamed protein product [Heligmosomoides polygyrus]|uniref:Uncharacterized protein n=1 Tax=Heligmosomoides polygyrus TaxID=6339 RepID=A0A183FKD8_HELPZ|nr:unnamed protein product [Heligmosomoides polygyrus]